MYARLRFLKVANVVLYLGPLSAGMAGLGWGMVAPFVSVFVLWLMTVRPEQWPTSAAEWRTGRALGAALTQILSQVLLVTVLLGLGRGFVGLAGLELALNPLVPLCVSIAGIFLSRIVWDARDAAAAGVFLDEDAEAAGGSYAEAKALAAIVPLLTLAEDVDGAKLRERLEDVLSGPGVQHRLAALASALTNSERGHAALRRATIIWATEPEIVAPGRVPNALSVAFDLSDGNADLLRLFLPRALALVAAFPDRASGLPSPATLRQAAETVLEAGPDSDVPRYMWVDLSDGLMALARSVETAMAKSGTSDPDMRADTRHGAPSPV